MEDARLEKVALLQRIGRLRGAVGEVERELQRMASAALDHSQVIRGMMDHEEETEQQLALEYHTERVRHSTSGVTIDMTDSAMTLEDLRPGASGPFATPDGSGRPPAARGTIDPNAPLTFSTPQMRRISGDEARAGRSLIEAIAASRRHS